MTWIGEVAHVAWKDVRQQRWLLVSYAALVVIATVRAARYASFGDTSSPFSVAMLLVVVLGCILGAVVVQGDSPTRADAFWLSRPFRSSAILAAKLLVVVGIVVALPLLGEAIGLAAFDVPSRDVPLLLLACLTSFGMWMIISVLLGGLTSDLRSFVVAFVVMLIVIGLLMGYLMSTRTFALASTRVTLATIGVAAALLGVLTLLLLYLQRSWRWLAWTTTGVASAGALLTAIAGPFDTPRRDQGHISVGPLEARVDDPRSLATDRERLSFRITAPQAPDSLTSAFALENVAAELADGSTLNLRGVQGNPARLHTADLPAGSISWLRHNAGAPINATVMLTSEEQRALAQGVRYYVLTGRVITLRPQVLGAMPLRPGSQLNSNGTQTRLASVLRTPLDVKLDVKSLGIDAPDFRSSSFLLSNERLTFALVNARAGQGLVLAPSASGMGTDWLVLPGTPVSQSTFRLQSGIATVPGERVVDISDEWFRDASLVVARWEMIGSYTTTIRTVRGD